jgi:benzoylformate decarboxylase
MRGAAKLFLERKMGRRAFVSRLARMGIGASVASELALSLSGARAFGAGPPAPGRVLEGLTGGELMAEFLQDWGVSHVFGLGGSEEVGFLDALVDRLDLHYVQSLHEGQVMSMADGYARASGKTALMNLHSIAGAGNALPLMVNAFKDRVPVVITVGRQTTHLRGSDAFLEAVNLHQLPREYAQWTWDVLEAATIPDVLRRAFVLARVPPSGPTFLTFSKDLWEVKVPRAEILPPSRSRLEVEVEPSAGLVSRAVDMLLDAEFPHIAVGNEVHRYGGAEEIAGIAETLGAPVFQDVYSSRMPVAFPTRHPSFAGMYGFEPDSPGSTDLFWSVGGTMFSFGVEPKEPVLPRSIKTLHSGLDAVKIARNHPVDLALFGHTRATARAIREELHRRRLPTAAIQERRRVVEAYHQKRRERWRQEASHAWDRRPIANQRLAMELDQRLDASAIVVSELVTCEYFVPAYFDIDPRRPEGRINFAASGGVLGWGMAAAIGAKMARPDRQVVALVGDGSFQFGVQALWSASRYEVPVAIVIWNNNQYQANRRFLHAYGGRAAATGKYIGCSLEHPEIDHVRIAAGYGVEGERVEDPQALGAALDRCLGAVDGGRAYVLDVRVERLFGGAESTWFDFFSVARGRARES